MSREDSMASEYGVQGEYGVQELMAVFLARDLNDGELLRVGVAMRWPRRPCAWPI